MRETQTARLTGWHLKRETFWPLSIFNLQFDLSLLKFDLSLLNFDFPLFNIHLSLLNVDNVLNSRQNRQNEMEAGRGGGKSPRGEGGDPHNETAMSEVSGDITLDSIRDHMSATLRSEGGDGVAATSTEVVGKRLLRILY